MKRTSTFFILVTLVVLKTLNLRAEDVIKVKINKLSYNERVTGKLIFLFDNDTSSQVIRGVNPNNPKPVFTYDIVNWNIEDTIYIKEFDNEWYKRYSDLNGEYVCRVIVDIDTLARSSFVTKGNLYSNRVKYVFNKLKPKELYFEINNEFVGWVFKETEKIKEIRMKSEFLSEFWCYDMFVESAIILPSDYETNQKKYPVVFIFPGFGSNHAAVTYGMSQIDRYGINTVGNDKIYCFMNAEFFQGYHHFADSKNNGPWGKAFIQEFVPFIEKNYRVIKSPSKRFLIGQSSGAWTATWLQVNYPNMFNGAFAASPDPLDFRALAFNIYSKNANFYFPEGKDSADIKNGLRTKLFVELEHLIGEYGQIRTWEATYSSKKLDCTVSLLFDRVSGDIFPEEAEHWKNYDISNIVTNSSYEIKELLKNKLHIYVSEDDPYGLSKSVKLFDKTLNENLIEAEITIYNDLGHNVWTEQLRKHIHNIIDNK